MQGDSPAFYPGGLGFCTEVSSPKDLPERAEIDLIFTWDIQHGCYVRVTGAAKTMLLRKAPEVLRREVSDPKQVGPNHGILRMFVRNPETGEVYCPIGPAMAETLRMGPRLHIEVEMLRRKLRAMSDNANARLAGFHGKVVDIEKSVVVEIEKSSDSRREVEKLNGQIAKMEALLAGVEAANRTRLLEEAGNWKNKSEETDKVIKRLESQVISAKSAQSASQCALNRADKALHTLQERFKTDRAELHAELMEKNTKISASWAAEKVNWTEQKRTLIAEAAVKEEHFAVSVARIQKACMVAVDQGNDFICIREEENAKELAATQETIRVLRGTLAAELAKSSQVQFWGIQDEVQKITFERDALRGVFDGDKVMVAIVKALATFKTMQEDFKVQVVNSYRTLLAESKVTEEAILTLNVKSASQQKLIESLMVRLKIYKNIETVCEKEQDQKRVTC